MKLIKDIAAAELKRLFYSPVAFILLIIFTFLVANIFAGLLGGALYMQNVGWPIPALTYRVLGSTTNTAGFFEQLVRYIYLFFPLLTMNMFSRDMGSGAFKLLLSSPVRNRQIVLGKYLALVVFTLVLIAFIAVFATYAAFVIENVDIPILLTNLLGLFLLCCTYAAIGLFLSSLTTHPIVAALCTLTLLMLMSFIGTFWQEYPLVRDITYWLSMQGRAKTFLCGMISSEDFVYFFVVIAFFMALTIVRLHGTRTKRSRIQMTGQYGFCLLVMCTIGYFTSRPQFKAYLDVTREQYNTLSAESQRVVKKLDGGLTITTYINMLDHSGSLVLPRDYNKDLRRFEKYTRFKPEIKIDHIYYYKLKKDSWYAKSHPNLSEKQVLDTIRKSHDISFNVIPYSEIPGKLDLSSEDYRFVRLIERENGKKTFLRIYDDAQRHPEEGQISAALKRLVETLPKVGFVSGHGERTSIAENDRSYSLFAQDKTFRFSLLNNGFDFETISLMVPVPDHINILIIADPRKPFNETEMMHYREYIARGGNLFLAGEPGRQEVLNPIASPLGVRFLPGQLTHSEPGRMQDLQTVKAVSRSTWPVDLFKPLRSSSDPIMMNGSCALELDSSKGYSLYPLYTADSTSVWNEMQTTDFIDDSAHFDPATDGPKKPYLSVAGLERKVNGKSQKILVTSDADWISNLEIVASRKNYAPVNFRFLNVAFYWLSEYSVPVNTSRPDPIDNLITTDKESFKMAAVLFNWGIPVALLATGLFIWIRRRGR